MFHVDALDTAPFSYIIFSTYYSQTKKDSTGFVVGGNITESTAALSGSKVSTLLANINTYVIGKNMWAFADKIILVEPIWTEVRNQDTLKIIVAKENANMTMFVRYS